MDAFDRRNNFVDNLHDFLLESKKKLKGITNTVGWQEESFNTNLTTENKSGKKHVCKFNPGHRTSQEKLKSHEERCSWIAEGYGHEEYKEAIPSSSFYYENSKSVYSMKIDKSLQDEILQNHGKLENELLQKPVPRTANRVITEFTPSERLAIYNYVVEKSKNCVNREEITVEQLKDFGNMDNKMKESDAPKSRLEILAEQRDYKRRRQSYRAKNVHITKRSYTEVMRELITSQVSSWEQYLKDVEREKRSSNFDKRTDSPHDESSNENHSKSHHVSPSRHHQSYSRSRNRYNRSSSPERSHKRWRSRSRSVEKYRKRRKDYSSSSEFTSSSESESEKRSYSRSKDHSRDHDRTKERSRKHKKKKKHKKSSKR